MNTFKETSENIEKTMAVIGAQSWMELKAIVRKHGPFTSNSRGYDKDWNAELILKNMELVRNGSYPNLITRACGLRAKVCELVLTKNYGDPWE